MTVLPWRNSKDELEAMSQREMDEADAAAREAAEDAILDETCPDCNFAEEGRHAMMCPNYHDLSDYTSDDMRAGEPSRG